MMRPLQLDIGVSIELELDGAGVAPDLVAPEVIVEQESDDHDSSNAEARIGSPRRSSSSAAVPPPKALLGLQRALSLEDGTSGAAAATSGGRKSPHVSSVDTEEAAAAVEESGQAGKKEKKKGVSFADLGIEVVVEGSSGAGGSSTEKPPLSRRLAAIPESHDWVGKTEAEAPAAAAAAAAAEIIEEEQEEPAAATADPPAPPARSDSLSHSSSDASVPMPPPAPASILRIGSSYLDEESGKPASPPVPRRGIKFADAAGGALQQVSYSDRLHFSPASHTRTWMDLPYNPHRPHSAYNHNRNDSDDDEEEDDDDDFDLEAFRRAYGGYTSSLRGNWQGGHGGHGSEFWARVRKSLRKRRRRLARRRREKEREQAAYRAWQRQQAAEDAVLWRPRGCCIVS